MQQRKLMHQLVSFYKEHCGETWMRDIRYNLGEQAGNTEEEIREYIIRMEPNEIDTFLLIARLEFEVEEDDLSVK